MIEQLGKQQKIRFFFQQAVAFGGIFLLLAVIVLSVLKQTAYNEVDQSIQNAAKNPVSFLKNIENKQLLDELKRNDWDYGYHEDFQGETTGVGVILWEENHLISQTNIDESLKKAMKKIAFKELEKNQISHYSVKNSDGKMVYFRYQVVRLSVKNAASPIYMQVISNVNQIRDSTNHSMRIVCWSMVLFWLFSLGVSFLLSHLFMRPILSSWHKQQEFVENASHELRTPLAVVQNQLELLFTKPEETILTHSEEIGNALGEIRRLRQLTTDLLTLARSDIQAMEAKLEWLDVAALTQSLVRNYQLLGESEGKSVTFEVAEDFPKALTMDEKLFQQLVVILLDNALKYTTPADSIQVRLERLAKGWSLVVQDTGIGIPDEKKRVIFERFTRVDSSRNRETGGFGLGLSIAKKIVEALDGKISVEDGLTKGTVFRVMFHSQ